MITFIKYHPEIKDPRGRTQISAQAQNLPINEKSTTLMQLSQYFSNLKYSKIANKRSPPNQRNFKKFFSK